MVDPFMILCVLLMRTGYVLLTQTEQLHILPSFKDVIAMRVINGIKHVNKIYLYTYHSLLILMPCN